MSSSQEVVGQSGGWGWGVSPLQGRQFCSQMYFYYTNGGTHIYLAPGGNTPLLQHSSQEPQPPSSITGSTLLLR